MKHISIERRRVAGMGGATAAISGLGALIHVRRPAWDIAWICFEALLAAATITLFVRWKQQEQRRKS